MKTYSLSLFIILLLFVSCGPTIYEPVGGQRKALAHKKIAILPSRVTIAASKKMDAAAIKQMQEKEAFEFQNSIYKYLLKRKGQGYIETDIQDVETTNSLLKKSGFYTDGKDDILPTPEEIHKILNVDGYITSGFSLSKPMSEGAAVAVGLLTGYYGTTNEAKGSLSIQDCASQELIWKYDHTFSGSLGSSAERLVDSMMKKASKKMPYYTHR